MISSWRMIFHFFCFCLFQMILAQRSVILLFLFLFLFCPTHSYQIWDWKERQKRRLERQSKRLALSGPVIANEVIDDQVIKLTTWLSLESDLKKDYPVLVLTHLLVGQLWFCLHQEPKHLLMSLQQYHFQIITMISPAKGL